MVKEPVAKRACDRCHAVKEKCRWIQDLGTCERCQRLRSQCQTLRPVRTPGRKPRYPRITPVGCSPSPTTSTCGTDCSSPPETQDRKTPDLGLVDPKIGNVPRTLSVLVDLNQRELEILHGIPQGRTPFGHFLLGPSFYGSHLKTFVRHLCVALPFLKDSLIAASALLAYEFELNPGDLDQVIGHKRAASAISSLRALDSFDSSDLSTVLILGVAAVTFALNISGNALEICRHTLNLVKPLYESLDTLDSDSTSFMVCLISSELEDCLLRCEAPTVRFKPQDDGLIDRYLGISTPMLSYLYDIGFICHTLRYDEQADQVAVMKALDAIEVAVDEWRPALPENKAPFAFSEIEVMSILTQANVFRWAILLICHRLRYPYGTETAKGSILAGTILEKSNSAVQKTNRSVPGITLPVMVACFELADCRKRQAVLKRLGDLSDFPKQVLIRLRTQLVAAWAFTDSHHNLYWCDLCTMLPQ